MTASERIDEYIKGTNDWRGDMIREIRSLVHEAVPTVVEEWKWNSPVFSYKGKMICSPGAFKTHVGLNFFNGALIKDTDGLFNSGLDAKKSRSINFQKGDKINKGALKVLLKELLHAVDNP